MNEEDLEKISYVEENKKCPICGSDRISIHKGVEIEVIENLKTGKILHKGKSGTTTFWIYQCRKCKWISETCTE